jgi:hypothetical protein
MDIIRIIINNELTSKDLMGVNLPSRFRYAHAALVVQLYVDLLIIRVLVRNHCLLVTSWNYITIGEVPYSVSVWLVVAESTLVVSSVSEEPFPFDYLIIRPLSHKLSASLAIGISTVSMFFAEHPPAWIGIFIGIDVGTLSVFYTILPLTWI